MSYPFITCHIFGGLGNQLYQIFTTFAIASKYGLTPRFKRIYALGNNRHTYWDSFLDALGPFLLSETEYNLLLEESIDACRIYEYKEPGSPTDFSPIELPISENYNIYLLHGYFQNIQYFENTIRETIELLRIPEKMESILAESTEKTIGIHFRIGDYKYYPDIHPILPNSYYQDKLIGISSDSSTLIYYFCEDEDWEEVNERIPVILTGKIYGELKRKKMATDWEEMLAMSKCDELIVANSTFSWWANTIRETMRLL